MSETKYYGRCCSVLRKDNSGRLYRGHIQFAFNVLEEENLLHFQKWVPASGQCLLDSTFSSGDPHSLDLNSCLDQSKIAAVMTLLSPFPITTNFFDSQYFWGQWEDCVHPTMRSGLLFMQEYSRCSENTNPLLLFSLWGLRHPACS